MRRARVQFKSMSVDTHKIQQQGASTNNASSSGHTPSGSSPAPGPVVGCLRDGGQRRGSFLYRSDSTNAAEISPAGSCSRASSVASEYYFTEDNFVTPFAQILAGLKNVRNNFAHLTSLPTTRIKKASVPSMGNSAAAVVASRKVSHATAPRSSSDESSRLAVDTLDELDWCLEQLESIQTGRSVSEMAESKFQKMLRKELSHLSRSKRGEQISKYLFNTFTATDHEMEITTTITDNKFSNSSTIDKQSLGGSTLSCATTSSCSTTPVNSPIHRTAEAAAGSRAASEPAQQPAGAQQQHSKGVVATMSRLYRYGRTGSGGSSGSKKQQQQQQMTTAFGVDTDDPVAVANTLRTINNWGMDVFLLQSLTKNQALVAVAYALFKERDLLNKFALDVTTFLRYFSRLQDLYRSNPYHNCIHAADVAQSTHVLLSTPALNNVFTDLENMAAIFAATIHDADHPGVTNQFLVNTSSELAILYNDECVLEQHHLAAAFRLLQESKCDFVSSLSRKQRQTFRRIVIDMVMATDMSKHMALLADFKTTVETKRISGAGSGVLLLDSYEDRIKVLKNIIHLCDLSNPGKPLRLYTQWTERITEEFWKQGDRERQLGLEPSPICDRNNADFEKSQVEFIDYIVHPLWETWAEFVYPDATHLLEQIEENRQYYINKIVDTSQHTLESLSAGNGNDN